MKKVRLSLLGCVYVLVSLCLVCCILKSLAFLSKMFVSATIRLFFWSKLWWSFKSVFHELPCIALWNQHISQLYSIQVQIFSLSWKTTFLCAMMLQCLRCWNDNAWQKMMHCPTLFLCLFWWSDHGELGALCPQKYLDFNILYCFPVFLTAVKLSTYWRQPWFHYS